LENKMNFQNVTIKDKAVMPRGFKAAGLHTGIKKNNKKDMALLWSEVPAVAAGMFTTNQVCAAPVKVSRERIADGRGRAVIVSSGNANACTGAQGVEDANRMADLAAERLGVEPGDVTVCSTGLIGIPMPMDIVEAGIPQAVEALSEEGAPDAAEAICTTDSHPKHAAATIEVDGQAVTISGMVKGAGMIHPKMATMLAFLTTDAKIGHDSLKAALQLAVDGSFNRISVDGDTSTNDTVICLANGEAGHSELSPAHPEWDLFCSALQAVALTLALKIIEDGEGSTRQVTVRVQGAASDADADTAARSVVNSIEVRASWNGKTAGWGRVMHALGYSRAKVVEEKVDVTFGGLPAARGGVSAGTPAEQLSAVVTQPSFTIDINLNLGDGEAVIYSCDCSEEYVRLNVY
jgi:glutamate N-acetyltransferase/amino-acid N-acetyltransferase